MFEEFGEGESREKRARRVTLCKAILLENVSPVTGRFAYPADVGVRVKDIEVACEGGKGRSSCENAMAGLTGDFVEHINEIEEKNDAGGIVGVGEKAVNEGLCVEWITKSVPPGTAIPNWPLGRRY